MSERMIELLTQLVVQLTALAAAVAVVVARIKQLHESQREAAENSRKGHEETHAKLKNHEALSGGRANRVLESVSEAVRKQGGVGNGSG